MSDCANGCMSKSRNDTDEPKARPATRGRLCGGCYRRLSDWLIEIPGDFFTLATIRVPGSVIRQDGSSRTKQPEAPAPARLDVIALSERRGTSALREDGDELWYELRDIPKTVAILHTYAETLRCDLDPDHEFRELTRRFTVSGSCQYLRANLEKLIDADWIDDAMRDINQIYAHLTRVHGLISGPAIGSCLMVACEGKVYRDRFTGFPTCNVCARVYDRMDTLRVQLTEEAAG